MTSGRTAATSTSGSSEPAPLGWLTNDSSAPIVPFGKVQLVPSNIKLDRLQAQFVPRLATRGCLANPAVDLKG